jgi:archaellin
MLTSVLEATVSEKKQIVFSFNVLNSVILYTVPEGKTCKGIVISPASGSSDINVNAVVVPVPTPRNASFEFVSGTVLRATGTNAMFVGVEE